MAYYPSSQITPNLHTNGGEFILSTSKENYKGYYYKLANGRLFTGKDPADKPNILLISEDNTTPINEDNGGDLYGIINLNIPAAAYNDPNIPFPINETLSSTYSPVNFSYIQRSIPTPYPPQLTPTDIQQGVLTRYFSKKNNELRYMEINKATFLLLINKSPQIAWDLYSADIIKWHIKGDREKVYTVNESLVSHLEITNKWWGFSQYFKSNFSKYYIES
jgi:hypothetical protein